MKQNENDTIQVQIGYEDISYKDHIENVNKDVIEMMKKQGYNPEDFILVRSRQGLIRFAKKGSLMTKKDILKGLSDKDIISGKHIHKILKIISEKYAWKGFINDKGYYTYKCHATMVNEHDVFFIPFLRETDVEIWDCIYVRRETDEEGNKKVVGVYLQKQLLMKVDVDHMTPDKRLNLTGTLQRATVWVNQKVKEDLKWFVKQGRIKQSTADDLIQLCREGLIKNQAELDTRIQQILEKNDKKMKRK